MKRTIKSLSMVAVLAIVSVFSANAQLGVQAGYVNSKFSNSGGHYNGFEIGINYNMPIQGGFGLDYALLYTNISHKEKSSVLDSDYTSRGHYLNLPVRLAFSYPINNNWGVFVYGGPNFALGVGGKNSGRIASLDTDVKWYGDNSDMARFDVMLGLGAGIRYMNIVLKGGYDWGLIDLDKSDNHTTRRNQFNISLAYIF